MKNEKSCGVIIYLDKPDTRYLVVKVKVMHTGAFQKVKYEFD